MNGSRVLRIEGAALSGGIYELLITKQVDRTSEATTSGRRPLMANTMDNR